MSPPVRADAVRQGAGERFGLAPPRVKTRGFLDAVGRSAAVSRRSQQLLFCNTSISVSFNIKPQTLLSHRR